MKHCPPDFQADAVALYESRPEATIRSVAADLRVNPETSRNWVRAAGASRPEGRRAETPAEPPTPLEAENAALRARPAAATEADEPQGATA
ncbi:transposase [Streptomyces sp. NPDC048389]|uniref:transposase n=1 Tax=Streptomyces sp. NPDC048389 TaxID=3154622 RepID=UPI0034543910